MAGMPWQPYLWLALSWVPGAEYLVHALTFGLFLGSALLLNRLLKRTPGISTDAQLLIPLVFAVFPVNAARIAHIDFPYTLSVAVFYLAWYLIAVDVEKPSGWRRVAAFLLFFFALLTMSSLLTFIALVLVYVVYARKGELSQARVWRSLIARYGCFVALPGLAWVVRRVALNPSGLYAITTGLA